jgi:hypothetical protein
LKAALGAKLHAITVTYRAGSAFKTGNFGGEKQGMQLLSGCSPAGQVVDFEPKRLF